ncbi:MAG: very short patch repair endonuclease [Candidatus Pacearchaeota archaeon]|nr:very short patch repair endonuclease [Candidatus Pacearchaeota archaeon]
MNDVLSREQRSYCMSRIQGKGTKPELIIRKLLWSNGHRYRIKNKLPGRPDIVFPGKKLAVFIDGCFWHHCPDHYVEPKTRRDFWENKISGNVERDIKNNAKLNDLGWRIIRIWEHDVKKDPVACVSRIKKLLGNDRL